MNFLDYNGLSRFFNGLKSLFADKNHTHQAASASSSGFMTSSDKQKIDTIDLNKLCLYDGSVAENPETVKTTCDYIDGGLY